MQKNKLQVIHILDNLEKGGKEKNVLDICRNIDDNNFSCFILCLYNSEKEEYLINSPKIKVVRLNLLKNKSVFVQLFLNIFQVKKIYTSIKKHKPDIIHTHTFFYSVLPVFLCVRLLKKAKHFHTIHTGGMHYLKKTFFNKIKLHIEKLFYNFNNTTLIAISSIIESNLQRLFPNCKISYVQNGIDLNLHKKELFSNPNFISPNGVYVARLVDGKNHITILKALSEFKKSHKDFKFTFIGGGPLHDRLVQASYDLGIYENIFFTGDVEDVSSLLTPFNFGVFASEYEGFSLALIEMMSTGMPVIVSNANTILDMGINHSNALLFETHDFMKLKSLILELFNDPVKIKKYSNQSINFAHNFGIEKMMVQLQSTYLA
jgi:glycosyltransferase involved in cell wall biosynthesis